MARGRRSTHHAHTPASSDVDAQYEPGHTAHAPIVRRGTTELVGAGVIERVHPVVEAVQVHRVRLSGYVDHSPVERIANGRRDALGIRPPNTERIPTNVGGSLVLRVIHV